MVVDGKPLTLDLLDELEESDAEPNFGVSRIEQFHWKALADFSACTECGRCQDLCPAWNTGKPLSPKLFTLALRDHHAAVAPFIAAAQQLGVEPEEVSDEQLAQRPVRMGVRDGLSVNTSLGLAENSAHTQDILGALLQAKAAPSETGVATKPAPLVGEVIGEAALWACTTCGACVDQCPVDIEHIDRVIDLRRNQVLMESAFPKELGQMFRKLESKGNPWGLPPRKRLEWAKGLEFDVPVVGVDVEDASEVDYLFWVGCAGAYEDRAKKTTRAVAELLHIAGVSFAVLGDGESCTGDPARRAGNEILFQTLAAQNVETLNEVGAKRIVVTCAHCFNTISREYPQVGGNYQVLHHTQLLNQLVREGRLKPVAPTAASAQQAASAEATASETAPEQQAPSAAASTQADSAASSEKPAAAQGLQLTPKVTYHDACYLGRHNRIYSPPRELLAATGAEQVEMPRNHERAFCCGGGGARAFMEETIGTRIAATRAREALDTGAKIVATACPFCTTMLSDGVASQGAEDVRVMDVAQLMLEAVKRGNN
jgi:possible Fe-S dehydrogenase